MPLSLLAVGLSVELLFALRDGDFELLLREKKQATIMGALHIHDLKVVCRKVTTEQLKLHMPCRNPCF